MKTVTMVRFDLDDDLHKRAKMAAAWHEQSLRAFIAEAVDRAVAEAEQEWQKDRGR